MGRPMPAAGEPLFTEDDTAAVLALAEEERDTCPRCGNLKAWCRDPAHQFSFEVDQDFCWASYRLADHKAAVLDKMSDSQRAAVQVWTRFREGHEPDIDAGLNLAGQPGDNDDQDQQRE